MPAGPPSPTRDELLEAPLLMLLACTLSMHCHDGCTRPGRIEVKEIAAKYGRRQQLRRAIARLICRGCRRRPARVTICAPDTDGRFIKWRVEVVP